MGGALRGLVLAVFAALLGGATGLWLSGSDLFRGDDGSDAIFAATSPAVALAPPPMAVVEPVVADEPAAPPPETTEVVVALAPPESAETVEQPTPPIEFIEDLPPWRRYAVAMGEASGPLIALVIDDMGMARAWSQQVVGLVGPLTLAYLPYAEGLPGQTEQARLAGHELIVHLPMEPDSAAEDTGPNALLTELDDDEIRERLDWSLARFGGYVGVSNHMGSRFTRDTRAMSVIIDELAARGLLFLDSRTTAETVGEALARGAGVPTTRRNVFIDNEADADAIAARLADLESLARKQGYAVGIGHPRPETIAALSLWLPGVTARGFTLAPISAIVARQAAAIDQAAAKAE